MKILHPFSKVNNIEIEIQKAYNYYLSDRNKTYLDAISGLYNCPLGYSVPSIKCAIADALTEIPSNHIFSITPGFSQSNKYLTELKIALEKNIPFSKQLFVTNSGSEAVDSAIGLCKLHSKSDRYKIISYLGSYHGSTKTTLSASGNLSKADDQFSFVDFYTFYDTRTIDEYLQYVENRIIDIGPSKVLAFIAEPFIGASGGFFMKDNVLPGLKKILTKYGIYLILDEVISGLGRLGNMFAFEKYNVIPDILILSKAITNGYMPFACCVTSFEYDEEEAISFGYTMSAHPASCAAATTSIRIIERCFYSNVISTLNSLILSKLETYNIASKCYKIENEGLFFAFHLSQEKENYIPYSVTDNKGGKMAIKLREQGISLPFFAIDSRSRAVFLSI